MAAFTKTPVPSTPDRMILDEAKANKAFKMKELVKAIQETSEKLSSFVDESGAILNEECGGAAEQLMEVAKTLQAQLEGTEKEYREGGPHAEENKSKKWYSHEWPKYSATEVVVVDLSEEASSEIIAGILGGGDVVRDVRTP